MSIPFLFVLAMIAATLIVGAIATRRARSAGDFFVAGRGVGVLMNASAISGEYLSAASFMGIAGLVMKNGYDALWYPVGYAAGYLFLLLFIAGPLRRFGAYTIPDFAEGRFDSPAFRKIAVVFVLFIGFFYTMPQMKGAGVTMTSILGWPYWVGIAVVGTVITFNVAFGGMKGITPVQAFQYWAKLFAISVPFFILFALKGGASPTETTAGPSRVVTGPTARTRVLQILPPAQFEFPEGAMIRAIRALDYPSADAPLGVEMDLPEGTVRLIGAPTPRVLAGATIPAGVRVAFGPRRLVARESGYYAVEFEGPTAYRSASEVPLSGGFPQVTKPTTIKMKGAEGAPANVMTMPANASVTIKLPKGAVLRSITSARKPEAGEDKIESRALATEYQTFTNDYPKVQRGVSLDLPASSSLDLRPVPITKNGQPVIEGGKPVRTGAKIEFAQPTEVTLMPGPVPNAPSDAKWANPFGSLANKWGYPLLFTYSLIIALVCGTAGLPHILVRFYTNPDGRAAKRTTLWVMVMLGLFYVFTPLWGTMGRTLLPALYANGTTDSVTIKLPMLLDGTLGQVLSGVTSAGAFAAFMSTFSGLLVSMSGAFAHDVYGRILRPQASVESRLRAFKFAAVAVGFVSMALGLLVQSFDIATMVGWAFAIGAASYFPLLLLGSWWRGLTARGAATGMLLGGLLSFGAIVLSMLLDKKVIALDLPPLARALMEQPAIWGVPLAITTMVLVSKASAKEVPSDVDTKMLRLHAPEELGLSRNYIEEGGGH